MRHHGAVPMIPDPHGRSGSTACPPDARSSGQPAPLGLAPPALWQMPPPIPSEQPGPGRPPPPPPPGPLLSSVRDVVGATPPPACPLPTLTVMVAPLGAWHGVTSTTRSRWPGTSCRSTLNPCFSRNSRVWSNVGCLSRAMSQRASTIGPVRVGDGCFVVAWLPVGVPPAPGLLSPLLCSRNQPPHTPPSSSRAATSPPRMIIVLRLPNRPPPPPGGGGCAGR